MTMNNYSPFVGRGVAFPFRIAPDGGLALAEGDEEIAESIRLILGTSPGERPMRPAFGCPIHDYVFAPADATTASLIAADVRQALNRWEPRIDLLGVTVEQDEDQDNLLLIHIAYSIREANDRRNLVFPFYVIPTEARRVDTEAEEETAEAVR
jgi:Bacteriophage baseplate protein W